MKAVQIDDYNQELVVRDVPEPTLPSADDVIIRIGGAGLCRTDVHVIEGQWAEKTEVPLPYTLGHENAGWVEQVGDAVTNVAVGDAVILHPHITCGQCLQCRRGEDMHCLEPAFPGIDSDGGMAEYLRTSARSCVPLPSGVEPKAVAAHADAGLTAYHAARKAADQLAPNERCVIIGSGGLGHIGIQCLAAMSAAEIIVIDSNPAARELALRSGAHHAIDTQGAVDAVMELTDGHGSQGLIDFVGEFGAVEMGKQLLRRHGTYYVVGYSDPLEIPTIDIISTEISFVGCLVGTYTDLVELMNLASRGLVKLETVDYPLSRVNDAIADLEAGKLQGRGILIPD